MAYFSYRGIYGLTNSVLFGLLVAIFFAVFTYFVTMILTKTLNEQELYDLPMGGRIVRLARTLGMLKE